MTPQTETFDMAFYCSVTDKPFSVRFERTAGHGLFRILDIKETTSIPDGHDIQSNGASPQVNADEFNLMNFKCPHCEHAAGSLYVQCGQCNDYVCGGRSGKFIFRCRPTCNNKGLIFPTSSLQSYVGSFTKTKETLSRSANRAELQITHSSNQGKSLINKG